MNAKTKNMVMAALFAALVCVATMIIKIPSPLKGYINLGDCIVMRGGGIDLSGISATKQFGIYARFA